MSEKIKVKSRKVIVCFIKNRFSKKQKLHQLRNYVYTSFLKDKRNSIQFLLRLYIVFGR